ncbi:MAG: AsmA-like C-terminal region-containing protein, partial [Alphaproteobacteria bacterium]|nr:AsmA-like C-terminal region-containing protein [Alphaproteobacteria bacterium]
LGFNKAAGETQKTDFAEITASYTVRNGLIENRDMKMLAPLVRLTGAGLVPMPPRQVDYKVEAKLVASIKGQGGKDSLAGLPIPIRITGSWDQPKYTVDWNSVFQEMARDPERLKNLPGDLKKTVEGLGIPLPLPGLDKGAATKPAEVLKGVLDSVGKKSGDGSKPSAEDAVNTLKGLFK